MAQVAPHVWKSPAKTRLGIVPTFIVRFFNINPKRGASKPRITSSIYVLSGPWTPTRPIFHYLLPWSWLESFYTIDHAGHVVLHSRLWANYWNRTQKLLGDFNSELSHTPDCAYSAPFTSPIRFEPVTELKAIPFSFPFFCLNRLLPLSPSLGSSWTSLSGTSLMFQFIGYVAIYVIFLCPHIEGLAKRELSATTPLCLELRGAFNECHLCHCAPDRCRRNHTIPMSMKISIALCWDVICSPCRM